MAMNAPVPIGITLHRASHVLEVAYDDGEVFRLPAEYLRVNSPSAEVQGHGPGQKVLVTGKADVEIVEIIPVGHYAVLLKFSDGHQTGIYSWDVLYALGRDHERNWRDYLDALDAAGRSREV
ncbi:MAG: DUF971 domain-containing protein [Dokdonella sp.]|nr:DUF971 domain-containing protein [Dokdonella sp.]MCW5568035.1 DUF971 domain-containing protein [Dokdonella sp.]